MAAFAHYKLIGAFSLNIERLSQLLLCVESYYCFNPERPNTYHTHVHAADVTLTVRASLVTLPLSVEFILFPWPFLCKGEREFVETREGGTPRGWERGDRESVVVDGQCLGWGVSELNDWVLVLLAG